MTRAVFARSSRAVAGIRVLGYSVLTGALAFGIGYAVAQGAGATTGVVVSVVFTSMAGWWAPPILSRSRDAEPGPRRRPGPPRRPPERMPR